MLGLNIYLYSKFQTVFSTEEEDCDCWNNTKNMEPADKKSKLSASREFPVCGVYPDRVGFFTFGVFKTGSERSWGRRTVRTKGKESEWVKRREKCVHSSGSRPALDCPQVLIPVSPSVSSSAISESINKTWWDGGRTGMDGREKWEERWEAASPNQDYLYCECPCWSTTFDQIWIR